MVSCSTGWPLETTGSPWVITDQEARMQSQYHHTSLARIAGIIGAVAVVVVGCGQATVRYDMLPV